MIAKILTLFATVATFGTVLAIMQLWRQQAARIPVRVAREPRPGAGESAD
jgi:hypothetical protein